MREEEQDEEPLDLTSQLSSNPQLLAALQAQLGSMVGGSSGYIESLPADVRKRVAALKNLQREHSKLEVQFEKEVLALEQKFFALQEPLLKKRFDIISGAYEPTEAESAEEKDEEEEEEEPEESEEPVKGIPQFWLTAFQNNQYIAEMIEEHDMPLLELLQDVTLQYLPGGKEFGYKLFFTFAPNDYFKETVLTKTYYLDYDGEEGQIMFEGPTYTRAEGCAITWNEGKNVTVKLEKKKQKKKTGKDAGKTRTVTKTVKQPSFFHFFSPPDIAEGDDDDQKDMQEAMLSADFEIGDILKDKVLPAAVLWFTGDASMGDDEDYGEGEEEDMEGEEEDEEDDGDFEPAPKSVKGGKPAGQTGKAPQGAPQNPECKQQ